MASQVMRITLKAYDHKLIDQSAGKIIETVKKTGSKVSGPVPLPTKKEVVTILRAVHNKIITLKTILRYWVDIDSDESRRCTQCV